MTQDWKVRFRKLWASINKENKHLTTERIEDLIESLLEEERELQNKLKEIAINNLITDVNTARKEERNAVLQEVAREWFKAKAETFSGQDEAEKCVETIISNLRIKQ